MENSGINTIDILKEIKLVIKSDTNACEAYSSSLIGACLYADIGDCIFVLSQDDYDELREMADYLTNKLEKAFHFFDVNSALQIISDMIDLLEALPDKKEIEKLNFGIAVNRHKELNTTFVIGDSHTCVFSGNETPHFVSIGNSINLCPDIGNKPFTSLHFGPCLAYTSTKYGTHNHFLEKFEYVSEHILSPEDHIIISLGEIDIRAHVFKEVSKQNRHYTKVIDDVLNNYSHFLLNAKSKFPNLYVWGPIASQKDCYPQKPDFPRIGTEQQRNFATKYFTERLSEFCDLNGMGFFSIFNKMVDDEMFSKNDFFGPDHEHIGQAAYPSIIEQWNIINTKTN